MGVTIKCKKTGTKCDLGYGGFFNLRQKVAELCDPEFAEHYKTLINLRTKKEYEDFDQKTEELLARHSVNEKVVDFCLQPDSGGKINYGACKEIYKCIKDYDDNIRYGYSGRSNCMMFKDFVAIIKECCDSKSCLIWY